jgi:tetratricopeptide (TPR) repeat protein
MAAGMEAMAEGELAKAIEAFDVVVELDPGFAEGWNRRATAHFLAGNDEASIGDIRRVLALEPRHFGALSGLGMILARSGQPQAALRAFEAALAVNPHLVGARIQVEALRRALAGDPT